MNNQLQTIQKVNVNVKRNERYGKGVVIAISRRILKVHGEQAWLVESEKTDGKFYKVTYASCECPDYLYRLKGTSPCKHMIAVMEKEAL